MLTKSPSFLMISGHDFRSRRKANVHFICEELARRAPTRMFSLGFSVLSYVKGSDPRLDLKHAANKVEVRDGVECYLWWTPLHPFNPRFDLLTPVSRSGYQLYRRARPDILKTWCQSASTIFIESGLSVLFIEDIRRWNPTAQIIYLASDDLRTIKVDPFLVDEFQRASANITSARLPSRELAKTMPDGLACFYVPHGIGDDVLAPAETSPYQDGLNAVSVGSMLFDPSFFHIAADERPDVTFHVIGSGARRTALPKSVRYYGEMPFAQTLPYMKFANFGVAPYRLAAVPAYLKDTSMKLMNYGALGIPAVCPYFVAGDNKMRFSYTPGDKRSIRNAIGLALEQTHDAIGSAHLSWAQVTDRLLDPGGFNDTAL